MHVIGTAGHVDHGKSALVKALTGIDPDRLKEEKEREMTIDLGFAWLTLPGGEQVGIVDVPGHKDFIKNMLAGIGGIDAALFVVAADEGVMPQTREHLAILDLLHIRGGVVALTKKDLVDEEWLELVREDVKEALTGTVLADAPIIPTSAKTGEGLDELVRALEEVLATIPPRPDIGRPRLPIDRVFTIAGFGTVVTGTLSDGRLRVGQEVEILPQGLRARIRGLQSHKRKIEEALPGTRVAVNLTGVSTSQLSRGDVLSLPGQLLPTRLLDVSLQLLADAPLSLKHNTLLDFFVGASEVRAWVRLLDREELSPGEEAFVQLRLSEPVVVVRGDHFIVRRPSPSLTIGGGRVIHAHPRRRYRRFRPEVMSALSTLASGTPAQALLQMLTEIEPCEPEELIRRSTLPRQEAEEALRELVARREAITLDTWVFSSRGWERLMKRLVDILGAYHRENPLRKGMPREELKSRLRIPARLFNPVIGQASREGRVVEEGATVRLPEHEVRFSPQQQRQVEELLAAFARNPYATPSVNECLRMVGEEVLNALIEQGRLIKVSEDVLFLAETYQEMVRRVVKHLEEKRTVTVAQVRDMFGTSRKYALALMEHLDERKVTQRVGDERILRR